MQNEMITFRATKKTRENIESIKRQAIERGINHEPTDSWVIREAISTLEEKMHYFIYQCEIDRQKEKGH